MATFRTSNTLVGLAPEATRGTAATTGYVYVPIDTPQVSPMQRFLQDGALRGSAASVYDQVQGIRHDEYTFKSYVYADTFPNLLTNILGGNDLKTGTGPYTHVIAPYLNTANGSQPQSVTLVDFDGANYFQMAGAQAADMTVTFGAEKAADVAMKFIANPYVSATTAPTGFSPSYSTEHMVPGWDVAVTIGGTASGQSVTGGTTITYVQDGEIKIDRKTAPIFTVNTTNGPRQNFAGPIEITGRLLMVVDSTADPFSTGSSATALTRSPQPLVITLTDPNDLTSGTAHTVSFQMSQAQFQEVRRQRGKAYTEVEVTFTCNANTNDIAGGSTTHDSVYGAIRTTTVNGTSTAYQSSY